jgi:hypothetical protein
VPQHAGRTPILSQDPAVEFSRLGRENDRLRKLWRCLAESTVNAVISKRFAKRQQTQ